MVTDGCPGRRITSEISAAHEAFVHYQAGFLPVAGGMLDQSLGFLSAVNLLGTMQAMHERRERDRSKR